MDWIKLAVITDQSCTAVKVESKCDGSVKGGKLHNYLR